MALPISGVVGPAVLSDGSQLAPVRQDRAGALVVSEAHGRYYETAFRKALFRSSNLAGVTTTSGFATTYTGFCLTNPVGSSVNLVVNKVTYASVVVQTAALLVGIMSGVSATAVTQTTPLVVGGAFAGTAGGVGLAASAVTLPVAPTSILLLNVIGTAAITTVPDIGQVVDLEGSLIVPPGGFAAFYTSAASAASSLAFGMQWEEVSING